MYQTINSILYSKINSILRKSCVKEMSIFTRFFCLELRAPSENFLSFTSNDSWFNRFVFSLINSVIRFFFSAIFSWENNWAATWDFQQCGVSKLQRRLHRLVCVYTCQNTTLLEITCHGSYINSIYYSNNPMCRFPLNVLYFCLVLSRAFEHSTQ